MENGEGGREPDDDDAPFDPVLYQLNREMDIPLLPTVVNGVPTLDKIVRVCFCLINPFTVNASPDEEDDVRHVKTQEEMGIDLNILMIPSLEGS
nr:DNA-binding protein HEXBP-like [Biomphalaria glabrata]